MSVHRYELPFGRPRNAGRSGGPPRSRPLCLATFRVSRPALADGIDPLALQRAFDTGMLAANPTGDPVYSRRS